MRLILWAAVTALSIFCVCGQAGAATTDPRIKLVEHGLIGRFYLAGRPRPAYSIAARMKLYRVPAVSIAVVEDYHVAWARAYGLRDVASNAPAQPTTLFQAASMSKPVAAAGILRLFQQRGLLLDADVNTMLRSWRVPPLPEKTKELVTMRRLLSHSAGINVGGFVGYDRDAPLPTRVQVLNGAPPANSEPIAMTSVPGGSPNYSGGGTTIAEQLAVDVSGEPFPLFMQQTILGPIDMSDSTFAQPLPESLWSRAANGYYTDGKPVHRGWHVYPTMAAAGLWSTATDLGKFVVAIQNALRAHAGDAIDASIAREMTTPFAGSFGLGLDDTRDAFELDDTRASFGHNGANVGFRGVFLGLLRGGRGVAIMTNSDNGLRLADEIVNSVATAYNWPVRQPAPKAALSFTPAELSAYAGSYHAQVSSEDVAIDLRTNGSELMMRGPMDDFTDRLYPETPTRFFTTTGLELVFSRDAAGKVVSVATSGITFVRRP